VRGDLRRGASAFRGRRVLNVRRPMPKANSRKRYAAGTASFSMKSRLEDRRQRKLPDGPDTVCGSGVRHARSRRHVPVTKVNASRIRRQDLPSAHLRWQASERHAGRTGKRTPERLRSITAGHDARVGGIEHATPLSATAPKQSRRTGAAEPVMLGTELMIEIRVTSCRWAAAITEAHFVGRARSNGCGRRTRCCSGVHARPQPQRHEKIDGGDADGRSRE